MSNTNSNHFKHYTPEIEEKILNFWNENNIFQKSIDIRNKCNNFIFYDGPPFATGLPHYGNLLAGIIKDVIPRYKTMAGNQVIRNFGWDCHGLPVEYEVEKMLNIKNKKEIEKIGIENFNNQCKSIVLRYSKEWENITNRIGRWINFENSYYTMDKNYMESVWWIFKELWNKNLIYRGTKVVPYCPRCCTSLSNFEVNQGYKDIQNQAITVKFQCTERKNYYYLAWTTTPWTLLSNVALTVGEKIEYVEINYENNIYVTSVESLKKYALEFPNYKIIKTFSGKDLLNRRYRPVFKYFEKYINHDAFKIIVGDHVTSEDGTGIVHTATGFGEDDYIVGKQYNLPIICPIDENCNFTSDVKDFEGIYVQDTNKEIIKILEASQNIIKKENIRHSYPHCWRDDTPLIYRVVSTWFMNVTQLKQQIIQANDQINWIPNYIKHGRFGKWLENIKDWAISRDRYWGCPLPIWEDKNSNKIICIGSVNELEQLTNKKFDDIHKHIIDQCVINDSFHRVSDVFDCWFESGSMPYAQKHYPFINKENFQHYYPADFIAEGIDQTRGWFYTMTVLSVALFNKSAFKNVIVNGLILAEDGQKMSKNKKNYQSPITIINKYGADGLRLFMMNSPCTKGISLKFSEAGILDSVKNTILPIWNAYLFLKTYTDVDNWKPQEKYDLQLINSEHILDKWILSKLYSTCSKMREYMDNYNLQKAVECINDFTDKLTNWYIRNNRRRFWKSENDVDKYNAYNALHFTLTTFIKAICPIIPFVTEEIYQNIKIDTWPESIHLCDYPDIDINFYNDTVEQQIDYAISIISLGRQLRAENQIKNRQPLLNAYIILNDELLIKKIQNVSEIIRKELNVKNIIFKTNEEDVITLHSKPNFKILGPKFGSDVKEISEIIISLNPDQITKILKNNHLDIQINNKKISILKEDIIVIKEKKPGLMASTDDNITVAIDTVITDELKHEGIVKEFINRIQNLRKKLEFNVDDRIIINYYIEKESNIIEKFSDTIKKETLANTINLILEKQDILSQCNVTETIINEKNCYIVIEKS